MDLADFLLARIAEDEREWGNPAFAPVAGQGLSRLVLKVLAECDAKRRIVEVHPLTSNVVPVHSGPQPDVGCETCHTVTAASVMDPDYVEALGPCETLRFLALPYADHPDYDESWRP